MIVYNTRNYTVDFCTGSRISLSAYTSMFIDYRPISISTLTDVFSRGVLITRVKFRCVRCMLTYKDKLVKLAKHLHTISLIVMLTFTGKKQCVAF